MILQKMLVATMNRYELARIFEGALKKTRTPSQRDLLSSSQAAWLTYRTIYCSFVSSAVEGGSIQPTIRNQCHANIARTHTKELKHRLYCQEGDLSCVTPTR
jgi:uncharacterized protein YecT (DUF1311 family)